MLTFHLFADDANLFYQHKNIRTLQTILNAVLINAYSWLCANKLSLHLEKLSFTIFHPQQRKLPAVIEIFVLDYQLKRECFNLGIHIDSNLSWKSQISNITLNKHWCDF